MGDGRVLSLQGGRVVDKASIGFSWPWRERQPRLLGLLGLLPWAPRRCDRNRSHRAGSSRRSRRNRRSRRSRRRGRSRRNQPEGNYWVFTGFFSFLTGRCSECCSPYGRLYQKKKPIENNVLLVFVSSGTAKRGLLGFTGFRGSCGRFPQNTPAGNFWNEWMMARWLKKGKRLAEGS